MKKNSIEEDIKILEEFIDGLKQYNPKTGKDIKPTQFGEGQRYVYSNVYYALDNILSDYKRVLKENEELKRNYKILKDDIEDERIVYIDTPEFEQRYIPVKKVKDKIEELKNNLYTIEHYETVGAIHVLQELIERRK